MQDPSQGVAQPLQGHVHLISGHRFPLLLSLNVEQAFRYLLDAPTIVKATAPMSWTYVQAPQDGTVWLEWIAPRNGEYRFPSDGYVWGDPEQTYRQEFGGYTVEMLVHTVGYRPHHDQMAQHARTRYHFIAKAPHVNAAPPDPSLWVVHYHQTEQNRMIPVTQVPVNQQMRQIIQERTWLQSQGRLERKEFMLHDREHWPTLNIPSMAQTPQAGVFANPMMQQQQQRAHQPFPHYPYQGQVSGQPPAKRPRHSGPAVPGSSDGVHDTSIEDEENTSLGDFFDHLSPREISMTRYMQHHHWMEEVLSSPYATSQIVPPDLGLGIMGALKGLTDGILDPPSVEELSKSPERPNKAKDAQPFTNLKKEQVDEFNRRAEKHLEEGRAEIERMKKEHAEKMAEWKKTSILMEAEKKLRYAPWEDDENTPPTHRLWGPPANGHAQDGKPTETVEDIVRDVERTLGVKMSGHKEATMVAKGGLEKDEDQQRHELQQDSSTYRERETTGMQYNEPAMSGGNTAAAGSRSTYGQQLPPMSGTSAEALHSSAPAGVSQPNFQNDQPGRQTATDPQQSVSESVGGQNAYADLDMGDTSMMDDMNMDADDGIDFIEHTPAADEETTTPSMMAASTAEPAMPQPTHALQSQNSTTLATSHTGSPVTLGQRGEQQANTPQPLQQATTAAAAAQSTNVPAQPEIGDLGENDPTMFDDGTFEGLADMDGGAGGDDGLIDFDGGMGMEDSAFGDALHGMDTNTPMAGHGGDGGQGDRS
ncbi:hypothetical protein LTR37_001046 [Vermiconidia calcicola]|uniref:Uncharacterized protein n=1 Tax=Vermiconidia calcicola TaxID=1690605 RepID=A0ACC3NWJ1_9PEZI|nr:hypothetical protein LTR37_001046 [Vermiconidia calcicola]